MGAVQRRPLSELVRVLDAELVPLGSLLGTSPRSCRPPASCPRPPCTAIANDLEEVNFNG